MCVADSVYRLGLVFQQMDGGPGYSGDEILRRAAASFAREIAPK